MLRQGKLPHGRPSGVRGSLMDINCKSSVSSESSQCSGHLRLTVMPVHRTSPSPSKHAAGARPAPCRAASVNSCASPQMHGSDTSPRPEKARFSARLRHSARIAGVSDPASASIASSARRSAAAPLDGTRRPRREDGWREGSAMRRFPTPCRESSWSWPENGVKQSSNSQSI